MTWEKYPIKKYIHSLGGGCVSLNEHKYLYILRSGGGSVLDGKIPVFVFPVQLDFYFEVNIFIIEGFVESKKKNSLFSKYSPYVKIVAQVFF